MELREFAKYFSLSERAYNICQNNGLDTLDALLDYYRRHSSFKNLRNCGDKTNLELIEICKNHSTIGFIEPINESSRSFESIYQQIKQSNDKWIYIESLANTLYQHLSVRAKNACLTLIGSRSFDLFDLDSYVSYSILEPTDWYHQRNVGKKTANELNNFDQLLKTKITEVESMTLDEIDLIILKLEQNLKLKLSTNESLIENLRTKKLDLIQFFNNYILISEINSYVEKEIICYILNEGCHESLMLSKEEVSKKLRITTERVRQLSIKLGEQFSIRFSFIKELFPYCYDLASNIEKEVWSIKEHPIHKTDQRSEIVQSHTALSNILYYLNLNERYVINPRIKLKGRYSPYDQITYKNNRRLKVSYVLNKGFLAQSILIDILNHVYKLLTSRIKEDYIYDFEDFDFREHQLTYVKTIVAENFGLQTDILGVKLKRNTLITAPEVLESILKKVDAPMTAEEIYQESKNYDKFKNTTLVSIRGALNNDKFIYLRGIRKDGGSKYGLKSWAKEKGLVQGSIKKLCYDFIRTKLEPVHIYDLLKYLKNHRKTNRKNVLTNLRLDQKYGFVFFKGGFIGLSNKSYDRNLIESFKVPSPTDSNEICEFFKNQKFYNQTEAISRFIKRLNLKPIQIKHIIRKRIDDGTLRKVGAKIYYNRTEEDTIVNALLKGSNTATFSGYDPYKIDIEEYRIICRLIISSQNNLYLKKKDFKFSKHDENSADLRALIYYQKYIRSFLILFWFEKPNLYLIDKGSLKFEESKEFSVDKLSDRNYLVRFPIEQIGKFEILVRNIIDSRNERYYDQLDDISIYNIDGLNKLDSYSHIIEQAEKHKGISLGLTEARRIYDLIKMRAI